MVRRILRGILMLVLAVPVACLVIIGLIDFDLMVSIVTRLIPVIVVIGVFGFIVKKAFFTKSNTGKEVKK
jgi:putative flippase GtrA